MKHTSPRLYPFGTYGYHGSHRAEDVTGFPARGAVSDMLRADPELLALEQQPPARGDRPNLDITDRWYPRD